MPSLKRTVFQTDKSSRTAALTESWKRAFDVRIREAALTRAIPVRRSGKQAIASTPKARTPQS